MQGKVVRPLAFTPADRIGNQRRRPLPAGGGEVQGAAKAGTSRCSVTALQNLAGLDQARVGMLRWWGSTG